MAKEALKNTIKSNHDSVHSHQILGLTARTYLFFGNTAGTYGEIYHMLDRKYMSANIKELLRWK